MGLPDHRASDTPGWVLALGGHVQRRPALWTRLGNLETRVLTEQLETVTVDRPIYVSGLARSGTTVVLEALSRHPDAATHRYEDYPFVFTPYWWNWMLSRMPSADPAPAERTHRDRLKVTPKSPEAFEEVLWMAFFDHLHDPRRDNRVLETTQNPAFDRFYREHLRKMLLVRGGSRYVAKGNYNVTRIRYLLDRFPDARFVVPVRNPVWHIASLRKQHRIFCEAQGRDPGLLEHMRRVGHFEFGLDWRPVNPGDSAALDRVLDLWAAGEEVRAWAAYWAVLYRFVLDQAEQQTAVRIVRYEDLCRDPVSAMEQLLAHCDLPVSPAVQDYASTLSAPTYYAPDFCDAELRCIAEETGDVAARLGYLGRD